MFKRLVFFLLVVGGPCIAIWASDRVTLQGERTIYTVSCQHGTWEGQRCNDRLEAGEQHRFRASRSRQSCVLDRRFERTVG